MMPWALPTELHIPDLGLEMMMMVMLALVIMPRTLAMMIRGGSARRHPRRLPHPAA